jgi:hypothetical protein
MKLSLKIVVFLLGVRVTTTIFPPFAGGGSIEWWIENQEAEIKLQQEFHEQEKQKRAMFLDRRTGVKCYKPRISRYGFNHW